MELFLQRGTIEWEAERHQARLAQIAAQGEDVAERRAVATQKAQAAVAEVDREREACLDEWKVRFHFLLSVPTSSAGQSVASHPLDALVPLSPAVNELRSV